MKHLLGLLMVLFLCNCNSIPNNKPKISIASIDLTNKGIGPVTHLEFDSIIDINLAEKGDKIFGAKCTSCHMEETRLIGPAMKGIYDRRSPEWVMNIMLNPTEMLKKDPVAKALLKEYNNVMMLNQNLTEVEARAIAEYLRTL
ncbi:MAG: cytochrome c [Flavobacteriaceae bacterium]|nr:cytochrome c [Flavobacteriaceae bacterium]